MTSAGHARRILGYCIISIWGVALLAPTALADGPSGPQPRPGRPRCGDATRTTAEERPTIRLLSPVRRHQRHSGIWVPMATGRVTGVVDPASAGTDPHLIARTEQRGSTLEAQGFFLTGTLRSDDSGQLFLFTSPQDQDIWATVSIGQLDPAASRTVTRPWETTWEQAVTRCVAGVVSGSDPPVVNPCASYRTDRESRQLSGVDSTTVAAQLVATRANWWFGDGRYQPYGREGIGVASYDINNPPPVRHLYTRSSLDDVVEGGYEVQLDATWEARITVTTSTGQSESFTIPGARTNVYPTRHAVRESQAIVGQVR
jgi:hypothetical protein